MASMLDQLGVTKEQVQEVEPEAVYESKAIPSALYDAKVDKAFVRKTDSGANMLEVDFVIEVDGKPITYHYSNCVLSGDQKGNKTTYTDKKTGNEVSLPGVQAMTKFLTAIESLDASATKGQVEWKDSKIEVLAFTGLQGKKLKIGVVQEENLFNGNVTIKNDVKYWVDSEGNNSQGKSLTEKIEESILKNPLRKLKASIGAAGTTVAGGADATAAASSGW